MKSSIAAGSAFSPMTVDQHLCARDVLLDLVREEGGIGADWRKDLPVPSYGTDARTLCDHNATTGSLPVRRVTVMVQLSADDVTNQVSHHQWYADHLIKLPGGDLTQQYLERGISSLNQIGINAES